MDILETLRETDQREPIGPLGELAADEIEMLRKEIEILRNALAYAVKAADGWHDDSHGGPIEDDDMDRVRALLPPNIEGNRPPAGSLNRRDEHAD